MEKILVKIYFLQDIHEITKLIADYWIAEGSEFRLTGKQFFNLNN